MSTTPVAVASGAWRPPQWNKPAMISITVPPGYSTSAVGATDPITGQFTLNTTTQAAVSYVFDAVLSLEHDQSLTKTRHPVQTGASITSHAYLEPASLVMYVLMSDVVGQYVASNQTSAPFIQQFSGNPSKSVSAYQQMLTLQKARVPLTVVTRLRTYSNMLIDKVSPHEDSKSSTGARFRLEFGQIFIASTQITPNSERPNDTNSTGLGAVNTQPVPSAVDSQFGVHAFVPGNGATSEVPIPPELNNGTIPVVQNGVPGYLTAQPDANGNFFVPQYPNSVTAVDVPGAGAYSSVNTNSLQQIPGI